MVAVAYYFSSVRFQIWLSSRGGRGLAYLSVAGFFGRLMLVGIIFYGLTLWNIISRRLRKEPDSLQTIGEILLNFGTGHLTGQIGEKGRKYYYLVLTIFVYIFLMNILGLIPKPEFLKPYTPTANINVTFGMAFVVFLVAQYQGFRRHGVRGYI